MKFATLIAAVIALVILSSAQVGAVDSDPPGFATADYGSSNLYANPGEIIYLKAIVTNIRYSEPDAYLIRTSAYADRSPGAPWPVFMMLHEQYNNFPGQSVEDTIASVTVPTDAAVGTIYSYELGLGIALAKNSGTMLWNVVTNAWDPYPSWPMWENYGFGLGHGQYTVTVIPEPSSIVTLLCGIGGMGGFIWRKKSA